MPPKKGNAETWPSQNASVVSAGYDQTKTVLPAEVAQGVYMQNAPGLAALKLMHLMISTAGGRMADDVQHTMSLADIRKIDGMDNHTRASITPLFAELSGKLWLVRLKT
jgi:hypothetical protein